MWLWAVPCSDLQVPLLVSLIRLPFPFLTSSYHRVIDKDPFHQGCLMTHISCLVELEKKDELFILSHQLVENFPNKTVSWFAVGSYYLCVKKYKDARKYFGLLLLTVERLVAILIAYALNSKVTTIDPNYGLAWIGFAHSFFFENELEPALTAYTTCARLLKGSSVPSFLPCLLLLSLSLFAWNRMKIDINEIQPNLLLIWSCHLPLLYIGMTHIKLNNLPLGEKFLREAHEIYPFDPLLLNELGLALLQKTE